MDNSSAFTSTNKTSAIFQSTASILFRLSYDRWSHALKSTCSSYQRYHSLRVHDLEAI